MKLKIMFLVIGFFILNSACLAQSNPFQIFEPLTGKAWQGHYVGSEDSIYLHQIRWEYQLDSMVVVETKEVPELNFKMITHYYFDPEKKTMRFLSLLNKNMFSQGLVEISNGKIILEGKNHFEGGQNKF